MYVAPLWVSVCVMIRISFINSNIQMAETVPTNQEIQPTPAPKQIQAPVEKTAVNEAVIAQVQEAVPAPAPKQAPVAVLPVRMFAVTIGDEYPEGSAQRDNADLRQIYYYNAQTQAEVVNKLRELYPDLQSYTVEIA